MRSYFTLLALFPLLGCVPFVTPKVNPATARGLKVQATLTRAFLKGADYERYAISDEVLYQECGSITNGAGSRKTLPGDDLLPPRHDFKTVERRVERLSPQVAAKLLAVIDKLQPESLPAPGPHTALKEPGKYSITIFIDGKKQEYLTSVDAIASAQSELLRLLKGITTVLRSSNPPLCGQRTFFGI